MRPFAAPFVVALLGWLAISTPIGVAGGFEGHKYVRVTVSLSDTTLQPGQTEDLQVALSPANDISIIANPAVEISLAPTRLVTLAGSPHQDVDRSTGYISTRSPVTQRFTVARDAQRGTYTVKGSLVYFYCSNSKGWCRKQVEPITLTITVAP